MSNVIPLRPKTPRKRLERDIVAEIRNAIGRLTWAVVWRNNTGMLKDERGTPVRFGLCEGSSDLVGIINCPVWLDPLRSFTTGRFFAIEVKRPGKSPTEHQLRYLEVVKRYGGAATFVTSADEAVAFLDKARRLEE